MQKNQKSKKVASRRIKRELRKDLFVPKTKKSVGTEVNLPPNQENSPPPKPSQPAPGEPVPVMS